MKKKKSDPLAVEILKNIRNDRARLEEYLVGLLNIEHPEAHGEVIVKAADALSKTTAHLIDVLKVRSKERSSGPGVDDPLTDDEKEEVYGEIDRRRGPDGKVN